MIKKIIIINVFLFSILNANLITCVIDEKEDDVTIEFFEKYILVNNKYKVFRKGLYNGKEMLLQQTTVYQNKGYSYYILNNGNGSYFIYINSNYEGFQYGKCNF